MRFSTNGKILVSISEDENKVLYAWDTSSGKELWRVPDVSGSFCFALSPDGNLLADVEEQTIVFRDLRTGKPLRRCVTPLTWDVLSRWSLAFSPDGQNLVARDGHALRIWVTATGREREAWPGHLGPPQMIGFSADGRRIAVAADGPSMSGRRTPAKSCKSSARTRDVASIALPSLPMAEGVLCVASPLDSTLRVWETDTAPNAIGSHRCPSLCPFLPLGESSKSSLPFLPMANTSPWPVRCPHTSISETRPQAKWDDPSNPSGVVINFAFSPAGEMMAVATESALSTTARLASGIPPQPRRTVVPSPAVAQSVSPAMADSWPSAARRRPCWELASGKSVCTFRLRPAETDVPEAAAVFTPTGALLVAVLVAHNEAPFWADNRLELWDVIDGKRLRQLRVPGNRFVKAAFAPDGSYLATGMADTSVLLWQPSILAGELERDGYRHRSVDGVVEGFPPGRQAGVSSLASIGRPSGSGRAFSGRRLRPADVDDLTQVIADLDSDDFSRREAAQKKLIQSGPEMRFALRPTLRGRPTLEMRQRIEAILDVLKNRPLTSEMLRTIRAVQCLEQVNTPAARRLLERLRQGTPAALLTQEAKSSLPRMIRRAKAP